MTWAWLVLCALGLASSGGFYVWVNDGWRDLERPIKLLRVGSLMLMLSVTYGCAEAYVQHVELGFRTPLVGVAFLVILAGVLTYRRND